MDNFTWTEPAIIELVETFYEIKTKLSSTTWNKDISKQWFLVRDDLIKKQVLPHGFTKDAVRMKYNKVSIYYITI